MSQLAKVAKKVPKCQINLLDAKGLEKLPDLCFLAHWQFFLHLLLTVTPVLDLGRIITEFSISHRFFTI